MEEFVSVRIDSPKNMSINLSQSNYNDDYLQMRPVAENHLSSSML